MPEPITRADLQKWADLWAHSRTSRTTRLLAAIEAADAMRHEIEEYARGLGHIERLMQAQARYDALVEPPAMRPATVKSDTNSDTRSANA